MCACVCVCVHDLVHILRLYRLEDVFPLHSAFPHTSGAVARPMECVEMQALHPNLFVMQAILILRRTN